MQVYMSGSSRGKTTFSPVEKDMKHVIFRDWVNIPWWDHKSVDTTAAVSRTNLGKGTVPRKALTWYKPGDRKSGSNTGSGILVLLLRTPLSFIGTPHQRECEDEGMAKVKIVLILFRIPSDCDYSEASDVKTCRGAKGSRILRS